MSVLPGDEHVQIKLNPIDSDYLVIALVTREMRLMYEHYPEVIGMEVM